MIFIDMEKDIHEVRGSMPVVLTEVTSLLDAVYSTAKEVLGEEKAAHMLATMGRMAVATEEELDEVAREAINEVMGGLK